MKPTNQPLCPISLLPYATAGDWRDDGVLSLGHGPRCRPGPPPCAGWHQPWPIPRRNDTPLSPCRTECGLSRRPYRCTTSWAHRPAPAPSACPASPPLVCRARTRLWPHRLVRTRLRAHCLTRLATGFVPHARVWLSVSWGTRTDGSSSEGPRGGFQLGGQGPRT